MSTTEIPLEVDSFLQQFGKESCVSSFSPEAVKTILNRISKQQDESNGQAARPWRDFFNNAQELWSEGVILLPRESLNLNADDIERLDRIRKLRLSKERCSELIYQAAVAIAERNSFDQLSGARFLI